MDGRAVIVQTILPPKELSTIITLTFSIGYFRLPLPLIPTFHISKYMENNSWILIKCSYISESHPEVTLSVLCSPHVHQEKKKHLQNLCKCLIFSVDQPGLEPGTSRLWVCCSNQLSYKSKAYRKSDYGCKVTNKRAKYKINLIFFLLSRFLFVTLLP